MIICARGAQARQREEEKQRSLKMLDLFFAKTQ